MATTVDELLTRARIEGVADVISDLKRLGSAMDDVGGGKSSANAFDDIAKSASGLSNVLGGAGIAGVAALGYLAKKAMDAESAMARLKTAFGGNESAAKSAYQWLKKYADITPSSTSEIIDAGSKLQDAGFDYQKWVDLAGKMAAAKQKPIGQAVEAIIDAQTGQYERMLEFGIRPDTLAPFGGTGKGGATQGAEGIQKNMDAIAKYVQTKWPGAIEEAAKTSAGKASTLEGNLETLAENLGKSLLPEVNKAIDGLTKLTTWFNELDDRTKDDAMTLLKWGTAIALVGSGALRLVSVLAGIRSAMILGSIAKTASIAAEKAEAAAVTNTAFAYGAKSRAMAASRAAWMAQGGMMPAAAGGAAVAGGGLWGRGSLLRIGAGVAGLGLMGYGLYQGYKGGQATAGKSLTDATVKNGGFWGGAAMTSMGAMMAAKMLLGTDLKTTLIIGVAAGIVYGFSRVAGRYNAAYSPEGIKDQIEAAITGTRPQSRMDKAALEALSSALERFARIPDAMNDAFDNLASGKWAYSTKYGELIRSQYDEVPAEARRLNPGLYNPFAPGYADIASLLQSTQDGALFGAGMQAMSTEVPQSELIPRMQAQYRYMQEEARKATKAMAVQASAIIWMALADWQITQGGEKKSGVQYGEAAKKAMESIGNATRKFADGLQQAAAKIREAQIEDLDVKLKRAGDVLSAMDSELFPQDTGAMTAWRNYRNQVAQQRADIMRANGQDRDADEYLFQLQMTQAKERKADQQDAIDDMMDELTYMRGDYDIFKQFRGIKEPSAVRGLMSDLPEWFGAGSEGAPTVGAIMDLSGKIHDALIAAGELAKASQFGQDVARWRMGILDQREKPKPNIAREILSTGGVSGLAEADISKVVSGGYIGKRMNGVFGPYMLSGASASRIRASMSQENERHVRIDAYVHPDMGDADDMANHLTSRVIHLLPKAFMGAGLQVQMNP